MHPRHRLRAEDLRLDDPRGSPALTNAAVHRTDLHVITRIDPLVVEVRAATVHAGSPAQHLGDLRELLEPDEVRDVPVLLRRPRGVQSGDRSGRRRRKDRRGLDELRAIASLRAREKRGDKGSVTRRAKRAKLRGAQPVSEDDHDLPHAFAQIGIERAERRRIGVVARADEVQHCHRDVQQTASVVVRRHETARAKTLDERAGHRRTILRRDADGV